MSPCERCLKPFPNRELVEERIEMRRLSDQSRFRTVKIRELCLKCAVDVVAEHRGINTVATQGSLL